jgi:hypothetical protein
MTTECDVTFDVNVDAETHRARPQTFGTPPEAEADTCGSLFFGEASDEDPGIEFINVPGPKGDPGDQGPAGGNIQFGFELPLGDDPATDGTGPWDQGGAVPLTPDESVSEAISKLNKFVGAQLGGGGGIATDGFALPLGDIVADGDGSWLPGAVILTNATPVSEAVDLMNEVLAKLVPGQPPAFPNGTLSITNLAGASPLLARNVVDNSGVSALVAGNAVQRITTTGVNSNVFNDVGPGDTGTISVITNGFTSASHALTGTGDNGTYVTGLVISDQKDFPPTVPGFWKSIDVSLNQSLALIGINRTKINHSAAGVTNEIEFVRDGMTAVPVVSGGVVAEIVAGTFAYSSSIPHYGTGAQLHVDASMNNMAGETYYGGSDPFTIVGTNGIISNVPLTFVQLGIATPIFHGNQAVTPIDQQTISVDGTNVHNSGQIQGIAKNVNGPSTATALSTKTILVKRGSAGSRIDENSIPVTGLGGGSPGVRVALGTTDKPAGTAASWDSTAALPAYEASVVGGVLKHDQTNYAIGFLPAGPNLSVGRSGDQYVTFSFKRPALSVFKINVTGNYIGCWVRLPGVTDNPAIAPNATNGWMDAFLSYDGSGVPGEAGDAAAGCALGTPVNGANGLFTITFGTQSSTNATANEIQVRFKLSIGQQITALGFSN